MYKLFVTEEFERDFRKCDNAIQQQIKKSIEQLRENPYGGKPLGYKFFREKKIENYRMYYIVNDECIIIFVIAISNKKNQQQVIDKIKRLMPFYEEEIKKRFTQNR